MNTDWMTRKAGGSSGLPDILLRNFPGFTQVPIDPGIIVSRRGRPQKETPAYPFAQNERASRRLVDWVGVACKSLLFFLRPVYDKYTDFTVRIQE